MNKGIDRHSVRIVLVNQHHEILLLRAEDPSTTDPNGHYRGAFWFLPGGEIDKGESAQEAAIRELKEETGLSLDDVEMDRIIWHGDFDLILRGQLRHMHEQFILARTRSEKKLSLHGLTDEEKELVTSLEWFSLERIKNSEEIIYPVGLDEYLEPVLAGEIPTPSKKVKLDRVPS